MIHFIFWIQNWDIDLTKKLEIWLQTEQQNKALQEAKIAAEKLIKETVQRAEQDAEKKVHSFFSFSIFKIFNFQISSLKSDVEVLSEWMKSQQKKNAELTVWKRHSQVRLAKKLFESEFLILIPERLYLLSSSFSNANAGWNGLPIRACGRWEIGTNVDSKNVWIRLKIA